MFGLKGKKQTVIKRQLINVELGRVCRSRTVEVENLKATKDASEAGSPKELAGYFSSDILIECLQRYSDSLKDYTSIASLQAN